MLDVAIDWYYVLKYYNHSLLGLSLCDDIKTEVCTLLKTVLVNHFH